MIKSDYVIRVLDSPLEVDPKVWNDLLARQSHSSPFMRHEYLAALHTSASATASTGWLPRYITLWKPSGLAEEKDQLVAACPLYVKDHSYGEYVFDWSWANAYAQHGLAYYPKAVVAVPFTPVPGSRLLARDADARLALARAILDWTGQQKLSSLHLLFASDEDLAACTAAGMMQRHTVQFHWLNRQPSAYENFEDFLASLSQEKRKKIRQERLKVTKAGVTFRASQGSNITAQDWDFFYQCYERTYLEHGNAPYLSRAFFKSMSSDMPENWLIFVAERGGKPIATSLIAINDCSVRAHGLNESKSIEKIAYGRYWGALERVDCLHFEACYYQPLQWCIEHRYARFEGGAQGEHKMARALMPVKTSSVHWLSHPSFANAVENFLAREGQGVESYLNELTQRSPFKRPD